MSYKSIHQIKRNVRILHFCSKLQIICVLTAPKPSDTLRSSTGKIECFLLQSVMAAYKSISTECFLILYILLKYILCQ